MSWRPIKDESHPPMDGTKFDGWLRDHRETDVYWSEIQEWWCTDGPYGPEEPQPLPIFPKMSHWMPTPEPPETEQ